MEIDCRLLQGLVDYYAEQWGETLDPTTIAGAILEVIANSQGHFVLRGTVTTLLQNPGFNEQVIEVLFRIERKSMKVIRDQKSQNLWFVEGYYYHLVEDGFTVEEAGRISRLITGNLILRGIDFLRSTGVPIFISNYADYTEELYNYLDSELLGD